VKGAGAQRSGRLQGSVVAGLLALAVAVAAPLARAAPEEAATVVPPRVVSDVPAAYPEGQTAEASVVLEVVVEPDGSSGELRVVEGGEPFAAAALEAVRRYRYEPARRGGQPIRARIRLVVTFSPPPPEAPPPPEPAPAFSPTLPPPPPPAAPLEVTIGGSRRGTSTPTEHRLGRADVRLLPGAFGDPFRAIEMLPGVVPTVSGLPYYYIRGAPPSAVGYYVDEVRVPYLFHFALGPGVIQPAIIEEVSLHPAAFPGRYGRYAGAIVAGRTREPAGELRGEAQIRIFDAGAYVEAPFANGRGSAGVGGRYSYTAALFSLVAPDTTIDYRDYNVRASFQLDDRWRASTFAFGSFDYASQVQQPSSGLPERDVVLFASEFHRVDLRLDRRGADGATSRVAVTLGLDRTNLEGERFAEDLVVGARAWHRAPVRPDLDLEVGLDTLIDNYSGDLPSPFALSERDYRDAVAFWAPRTDTATGTWASATWHPAKGFELTGTARADFFTSAGKTELGPSPRASMRVPLTGRLAFLGALGIAPQPPVFAIPIPAVGYRGLPGGIAHGYQKSAGAEVDLPLRFLLRAVGFHHTYLNLRDFARNARDLDIEEPQPVPSSPAQAYGLELSLTRRLSERLGGFVSYTLSRSEIGSTTFEAARVSPFDRTHVFQVGGSVDLGAGWRTSLRFLTYRGWPSDGPGSGPPLSRRGSAERLPAFVRLDARIEKRWRIRKAGYISLVLEGLNTTATEEIVGRECDPLGCRNQTIGPIVVPSFGVEGAL
jgi:TonB family protein